MKTIGILRELAAEQIVEIAEPVGVVAAILPTTNPTSTAIYKILIALKAGNAVVLSPHPRARRCTCATIDVLERAALAAGAPQGLIQCIQTATMEATQALMRHKRTSVILATGGSAMVKAAYSSGKPAYGVGPGNVPVLVDESADVSDAITKVVAGKSFDFGTLCSSEQTVVAVAALREKILTELKARKAYLCDAAQGESLAKLLLDEHLRVKPECVGQCPVKIARMAGFAVPSDTSILVVEIAGIGKQHPLSAEKLSPVLSLYFVKDHAAALDACEAVLRLGGLGHTCVIHSADKARILEYGRRMPAFRVLVNTSSPLGSTGITTNVSPAMTLGCGALAGNATSDNVGPQHLFNIKRVAWQVREAVMPERPVRATVAMGSEAIDKQAVVSAVERYLSSKGVAVTGGGTGPVSATLDAATQVVDRFLGAKHGGSPSSSSGTAPAAGCGCALPAVQEPAPAAKPEPPQPPPIPIVDFVCENDVRMAIRERRKIYIGPKTIVTPAARDLATDYDILIQAQRS
jgi:acetaldehyde dehydrogenase (acetylating)